MEPQYAVHHLRPRVCVGGRVLVTWRFLGGQRTDRLSTPQPQPPPSDRYIIIAALPSLAHGPNYVLFASMLLG
jgi:hypothetical protein